MAAQRRRAGARGTRGGKAGAGGFPVAIIGMACRFPGAGSVAEYWRMLTGGVDAITEVPADRFDVDAVYDPEPATPGRIATRWGGFLDGIDRFDEAFFGVAPREAAHMDPQLRLLLETCWNAIEDAGLAPGEAARRTGVFVGQHTMNYWDLLCEARALDIYAAVGATRAVQTGRLSYAFDLRGPSVSVDAACASSLVAVHLACQSLRTGESSVALAAGVNLILHPDESITFSQAGMLAPDGRCKFAAAGANGFVRSEGVGVVVLKPLDQAVRDGDRVHAVIHGTAVGNDGHSSSAMMTPAVEGQVETLRAAYAAAGIDPAQVGYVEAHGTGTGAGDPVELTALAEVLGAGRDAAHPLVVGSVKSNIGHAESAAGMAGLIKAVLCLQHRAIPPSLHSAELTPALDWDRLPVVVQRENGPWPDADRPAVAGVSSLGISGTNAHCVVGEYRPAATESAPDTPGRPRLLAVSAETPEALAAQAEAYADRLEELHGAGVPLRDICFSAATRRSHLRHRLTAVGAAHGELAERLRAFAAGVPAAGVADGERSADDRARTVFVFPGQGSQWAGMGRELLATEPVFRAAIEECDAVIRAEAGWSLLDRLADDAPLAGADAIQPALWAMEVALAALWRSWGVEPDAVVGHSMGEAAAAYVAGALSLADSGAVICRRSALAMGKSGQGLMASVELAADEARRELAGYEDRVSVAAINGPNATVLSGDTEAIERIVAGLEARDVFARLVQVEFASHSPQMDGLREPLAERLAGLAPRAGTVPLYSTVLAEPIDGHQMDAGYWSRNLREPVGFGPVVRRLLDEGPVVFIEISPHPILLTGVNEYLAESADQGVAIPSLRRDEPERATMLDGLGAVHRYGRPVGWAALFEPGSRYVRLPEYPWQRRRHWFAEAPARPAGSGHPILGPASSAPDGERVYERAIDMASGAYLNDHRVQDTAVLPGTAYLEAMLATGARRVENVSFQHAVYLPGGTSGEGAPVLRVAVARGAPAAFTVSSRGPGETGWTVNVTGQVAAPGGSEPAGSEPAGSEPAGFEPAGFEPPEQVRRRCAEHLSGADFYAEQARMGNQWLGAFQGIAEVWRGAGEALARVRPTGGTGPYHFHPALLDACLQALPATVTAPADADGGNAFLLRGIDGLIVHRRPEGPLWSHAMRRDGAAADPHQLVGDIRIMDATGAPVAEVRGMRLRYFEAVPQDGTLYEVAWRPAPAQAGPPAPGRWIVFADAQGPGRALGDLLGEQAVMVTPGDGFRRLAAGAYRLDPGSPQDYERLLANVTAEWDEPPAGVVHLWSLDTQDAGEPDTAALDAAQRLGCHSVLNLVRALDAAGPRTPPRLWLVTRGAQWTGPDDATVSPAQAALWGFGRTLAVEDPALRCTMIDLPADPSAAGNAAALLHAELAQDGERQLALRPNGRLAARLIRRPEPSAQAGQTPHAGRTWRIGCGESGGLADLALRPAGRPAPGPGEVEIETSHTALNYRDVLRAADLLDDAHPELGWECAGRISALGPGVTGLRVGDEVVALAGGAMAAHVVTSTDLVFPLPAGMSAGEAVTLPVAFLTAYYGLCELARLREGDRVLIHSATGGVGLAAVQIARWRGAEIFATAGGPGKRAQLRLLGIRHVLDSRSLDYAAQVMALTRGEGVQVVLNTLGGEAIPKNLEVLAPYGRYVELTRRDLLADRQIGMAPLLRNLSVFALDVADMIVNRPAPAGRALGEVLRLAEGGTVTPLPYEEYPAAEAAAAFARMAQARHVGKLVLAFAAPAGPPAGGPIGPDGTYLVTGGLGELGRRLARWLVDRGARHLLLTGRSAVPADAPALAELVRAGAQVEYHVADAADEAALRGILRRHRAAGRPPVHGVVHAAGVLAPRPVSEMTAADLDAALRAKLLGGWALHRAVADEPVRMFVLFSSFAALLGSPRLAAYAAGNAALDALARHRRAAGLPALAVNWAAWESLGMVGQHERATGRPFSPQGMAAFTVEDGLRTLDGLLAEDAAQAAKLVADWRRWSALYPDAAADPLLREVLAGPAAVPPPRPAPPPPVPAPRVPAPPPPAVPPPGNGDGTDAAQVETVLTGHVARVLGMPPQRLKVREPLNRQGLDSLMAAEVRRQVQRELGVLLPITKMLGGRSLRDLVTDIVAEQSAQG